MSLIGLLLLNLAFGVFFFRVLEGSHSGSSLFVVLPGIVLLVADFILFILAVWRKHFVRAIAFFFAGCFIVTSAYLGTMSAQRAFNSCVDGAENLRLYLVQYKNTQGDFPDSLEQVDQGILCGKRWLNSSLLSYKKENDDFLLSFTDGVVTFSGSSKLEMTASK